MIRLALLSLLLVAACAGPDSSLSANDADACAASQARRDIGPHGREAPPPAACRLRFPIFSFR